MANEIYHGSFDKTMTSQINQDNLYLILPGKVTQWALLYAKRFNVNFMEAIRAIYTSNTYKELEREETKLWHLGPVALMQYMAEHN